MRQKDPLPPIQARKATARARATAKDGKPKAYQVTNEIEEEMAQSFLGDI